MTVWWLSACQWVLELSLSNVIQILSVFMPLNIFPVKATDNIILTLSPNVL